MTAITIPSHSYSHSSPDLTLRVEVASESEVAVTYSRMNKQATIGIERKITSITGIWSPAVASRLENADTGGALVKSEIDEGGGYEKVERGTVVDSSSCCEEPVRVEWEIEESESMGVDVACNKLVRECALAVCSMASV